MSDKPLVGISTCLLGEKVRYDGGDKLDPYIRDVLGEQIEFVSICPEVECGMDVPREKLWLVSINGDIRLMTQRTEKDMTMQMQTWMQSKLAELSRLPLCGYIFKARSPSCGLTGVKCYEKNGDAITNETGIFAKALLEIFPSLPVEEETRLHDDKICENFIDKILNMQRWHASNKNG